MGRALRTIHRKLYADGEHVNFYTIGEMRSGFSSTASST